MKTFSIYLALFLVSVVIPLNIARAADKRDITVAEAKQKIEHGALVIDVRSAKEFSTGHLPNAINIPHDAIESNLKEIGDDKNKEIVVYCHAGRRASKAKETLAKLGYKNVFNAGGYESLSK